MLMMQSHQELTLHDSKSPLLEQNSLKSFRVFFCDDRKCEQTQKRKTSSLDSLTRKVFVKKCALKKTTEKHTENVHTNLHVTISTDYVFSALPRYQAQKSSENEMQRRFQICLRSHSSFNWTQTHSGLFSFAFVCLIVGETLDRMKTYTRWAGLRSRVCTAQSLRSIDAFDSVAVAVFRLSIGNFSPLIESDRIASWCRLNFGHFICTNNNKTEWIIFDEAKQKISLEQVFLNTVSCLFLLDRRNWDINDDCKFSSFSHCKKINAKLTSSHRLNSLCGASRITFDKVGKKTNFSVLFLFLFSMKSWELSVEHFNCLEWKYLFGFINRQSICHVISISFSSDANEETRERERKKNWNGNKLPRAEAGVHVVATSDEIKCKLCKVNRRQHLHISSTLRFYFIFFYISLFLLAAFVLLLHRWH